MKILVRNLSRETTEAELLALFQAYGEVQYCTLVIDSATKKSKGFGFVEMPRAGEAKAAIKGLNARDIGGNKIRVKKAEQGGQGDAGKDPGAADA
jgi:RNA recognition motif-containing protein